MLFHLYHCRLVLSDLRFLPPLIVSGPVGPLEPFGSVIRLKILQIMKIGSVDNPIAVGTKSTPSPFSLLPGTPLLVLPFVLWCNVLMPGSLYGGRTYTCLWQGSCTSDHYGMVLVS